MDVPDQYAREVDQIKDELRRLVSQAREAAERGDQDELVRIAAVIQQDLEPDHLVVIRAVPTMVNGVRAELDALYDAMFPLPGKGDATVALGSGTGTVERLEYAAAVLDAPWPTAQRTELLYALLDSPRRTRVLDPLAVEALAAPASPSRTRLLRLILCSPLGDTMRETAGRVLDALHLAGALDAEVLDAAFREDEYLGYAIVGRERDVVTGQPVPAVVGPGCAAVVRDHLDALTWRLTRAPNPVDWHRVPRVPAPRGLRFVLRGLDVWAGRLSPAPGASKDDRYGDRLVDHLCAAELTADERETLAEVLRDRPEAEQREAFARRDLIGDAEPLLGLFGLAQAAPMYRLLRTHRALTADEASLHAVRIDLAEIRSTVALSGEQHVRQLLNLLRGGGAAVELVSAALGWNRAAVLKRFRNHALRGIAAFGLLPLSDDETALDRYLALRQSAKKGATLGPNRRHSHAAAIDVALDHLAQVAGYPDTSRLEWDLESRVATGSPGEWQVGDYRVSVRLAGADPVIEVTRDGRALRSVPPAVRGQPGYAEARERQERLRDQARRMRTGLVERLVATAGTVERAELDVLLSLPAGAAMLPGLIWRDSAGVVGLLDPDVLGDPALVGLDGARTPVTGSISAVHPAQLFQTDTLAGWQAEVVRRRLRQPVKQAFRELYVLTPAERSSGTTSLRFAGHHVDGRVAVRLLSARGWSSHDEYDDHQATRRIGGLTAGVRVHLLAGYFGGGPVRLDGVSFLRDGVPVDLAEVPATAFSEVMRDLDLVSSVAGTGDESQWSVSGSTSRAQLLGALITDLGLVRVAVDGHHAVIRGARATYRVHLGSGSIHLEPGGHLCVVPSSFGNRPHRRLFLPFADEDTLTSVVLSKVLLLAEDAKITDPSILAQLPQSGGS